MKATQTIPIVMLNGNFPVEMASFRASRARVAMSPARPTGHRPRSLPSTSRSSRNWRHAPIASRCCSMQTGRAIRWTLAVLAVHKRAADQLGMTVHYFDYRQPEDVPATLNAIAASGIKAMFYNGDPVLRTRTAEIMAFLRDQRMASIATIPTFAEAGGLAHYAPTVSGFYDRTASFVDRILRGAKPVRSAGRRADELRVRHQPQDRQGDRPGHSAKRIAARHRGDRIAACHLAIRLRRRTPRRRSAWRAWPTARQCCARAVPTSAPARRCSSSARTSSAWAPSSSAAPTTRSVQFTPEQRQAGAAIGVLNTSRREPASLVS